MVLLVSFFQEKIDIVLQGKVPGKILKEKLKVD